MFPPSNKKLPIKSLTVERAWQILIPSPQCAWATVNNPQKTTLTQGLETDNPADSNRW